MTAETIQQGVVSDGNGLVLFVPAIANPLAPLVSELTASTVKKLTYGITGDGYNHTVTINKVTANRLTLPQTLQLDGTETDELSITYVYRNMAGDVIRLALPVGTEGFIVERWAVANEVDIAADQLVDVIPIKASVPLKNAPVTNQELTRTQALNVIGKVRRDVKVLTAAA